MRSQQEGAPRARGQGDEGAAHQEPAAADDRAWKSAGSTQYHVIQAGRTTA
jgi:hypothetical protein